MTTTQPRKQRKAQFTAHHAKRRNLMRAHLSRKLLEKQTCRSFPLAKGDKVQVIRGDLSRGTLKGSTDQKRREKDKRGTPHEGRITRVDISRGMIYIEGALVGTGRTEMVERPIHPSNVILVDPNLSDPRRKAKWNSFAFKED